MSTWLGIAMVVQLRVMAASIGLTNSILSANLPRAPEKILYQLEQDRSAVYNHLRRLLHRPELLVRADDLMQETFVRAYRHINDGKEVRSGSTKAWLLRIQRAFFWMMCATVSAVYRLTLSMLVLQSHSRARAVCSTTLPTN